MLIVKIYALNVGVIAVDISGLNTKKWVIKTY
jgi:hypothetical protein